MKSIAIKVALISLALGATTFALAGTADASHVKAEIAVPSQATVGHPVQARVSLHSAGDGSAIANAPVTFYSEASFAGVTGDVELGRSVTDENGVAILNYQPRSAGDHQIRVAYASPGDGEPEVTTISVSVAGGPQQLYRSTAGIQIPGLNVWLLIAGVTGVWAILFSVALRVIAIARAGTDAEPASQSVPRAGHMETQPAVSRLDALGGR